ncbi:MAG: outer membrane beta-barrel protein [Woeseiaceae bacterium]
MLKPCVLAAGAALALPADGTGAEPMIREGHHEVSLHISPDLEGPIGDTIFFQAGYGVFLRDGIVVRAMLSHAVLEDVAGEDTDYRSSEAGIAGEYHFDLGGNLVPYLGLGLGWHRSQFADLDESALVYGPRFGMKYFVADNAALDLEITYEFAAADVFINDFEAEDTDLSSAVGFRILF